MPAQITNREVWTTAGSALEFLAQHLEKQNDPTATGVRGLILTLRSLYRLRSKLPQG